MDAMDGALSAGMDSAASQGAGMDVGGMMQADQAATTGPDEAQTANDDPTDGGVAG